MGQSILAHFITILPSKRPTTKISCFTFSIFVIKAFLMYGWVMTGYSYCSPLILLTATRIHWLLVRSINGKHLVWNFFQSRRNSLLIISLPALVVIMLKEIATA